MSDKINFELPRREQKTSNLIPVIIILLVFLIVIGIMNVVITMLPVLTGVPSGGGAGSDRGLSAEETKDLALKLQKRSLHEGAVRAWTEYMDIARLSAKQKANTLYEEDM